MLRRWFCGSAQCASISPSGSFLSMCICGFKKYCVSLARLDLNRRLRLTWLGLAWLYAILNVHLMRWNGWRIGSFYWNMPQCRIIAIIKRTQCTAFASLWYEILWFVVLIVVAARCAVSRSLQPASLTVNKIVCVFFISCLLHSVAITFALALAMTLLLCHRNILHVSLWV